MQATNTTVKAAAKYASVQCWMCAGWGTVRRDTMTTERDDRCTMCAGKGSIVVERQAETT